MKDSDKYLKLVEWSEEDNCYVGTCPELFGGGCHGDDEARVYKDLCKLTDEWIEIYKTDGKPLPKGIAGKKFSGKFGLRIGQKLHKKLVIQAKQSGESLNTYCKKILEQTA